MESKIELKERNVTELKDELNDKTSRILEMESQERNVKELENELKNQTSLLDKLKNKSKDKDTAIIEMKTIIPNIPKVLDPVCPNYTECGWKIILLDMLEHINGCKYCYK